VIVFRSAWAVAVAVALALPGGALASGCGSPQMPEPELPAPPPKARNAAEIARDIVHARVSAMIYVEQLRGRPLGEKIESLELFRPLLEGSGIRPEVDIDRAFIAADKSQRTSEWILVAEHRLSNDRLKVALESLFATGRLEGAFLDTGGSVPMARVTARGYTLPIALALIEPNFLVLLPEAHAVEAARFVGTGGFPDPTGKETVIASALDPSNTLRGPRLPPIPPTITSGDASITLTDDGGADVTATAQSTSPEQAIADAAAMSESVEAATSIKVAFMRLRLFKSIPFTAAGDQVKSRTHVTAGEIDSLFGALAAILPR
jgi:hypothetical protein